MSNYVIGIDGGGTSTRGVLAESTGVVCAHAETGLSNIQITGADGCAERIFALVGQLMQSCKVALGDVGHIYLGLAGAGRSSDRRLAQQAFNKIGLERFTVDSDASVALSGAFAGEEGIIVIAGTGSICYGKSRSGEIIRSGGWGYLLGDEGSGYVIGRDALVAALQDLDGRGESTALRAVLEKHLGIASIDEIIPRVYSGKLDRAAIAALAPLVFAEAQGGDAQAQRIITATAREHARMIEAVANKLDGRGNRVRVALIGSIFKQKAVLEPIIKSRLLERSLNIELLPPRFEPVVGAVILALLQIGVTIDKHLLGTLSSSLPETGEAQREK